MDLKTELKKGFPYLVTIKRRIAVFPPYQRYKLKNIAKTAYFPKKSQLGQCGKNSVLEYPVRFSYPRGVFIEENVKVRSGCHIVNSSEERVVIKKYTVLAFDCMILTNSHRSTVGIPQFLLGSSHINDKSADVVIEEDVWVGVRVTLLPGTHLGRGCIVGAGSIVSGEVPPYALVVGSPARVVKKTFPDVESVMRHEKSLYPLEQRMTKGQLQTIFDRYFEGKKTYGVDTVLTEEQHELLNDIKEGTQFVEPY